MSESIQEGKGRRDIAGFLPYTPCGIPLTVNFPPFVCNGFEKNGSSCKWDKETYRNLTDACLHQAICSSFSLNKNGLACLADTPQMAGSRYP